MLQLKVSSADTFTKVLGRRSSCGSTKKAGNWPAGTTWSKRQQRPRQKLSFNLPSSIARWIKVVREVIVPTQVTMENQATTTWDPRDEPITSVEDTQSPEESNPESKPFDPNISHSQTNTPHKKSIRLRNEQYRLEQARNPVRKDLS